ncbi:hypothetical protein B5G33_18520 [Blautia sp. An81]|nr:hypothetical protein B5G33_18520 [Blautia sp. An81]
MSFFVRTRHKEFFSVGCRSPPTNLDFSKKFRLEGTIWLITKPKKKRNGGSGKKPKKINCGA